MKIISRAFIIKHFISYIIINFIYDPMCPNHAVSFCQLQFTALLRWTVCSCLNLIVFIGIKLLYDPMCPFLTANHSNFIFALPISTYLIFFSCAVFFVPISSNCFAPVWTVCPCLIKFFIQGAEIHQPDDRESIKVTLAQHD